jgi:lipopolysaccharide export system protein LptC
MTDVKSANRFRLIAILSLVVVLALSTSWLNLVMKKSMADFYPTPERSEPDYYVQKFSYVRMTPLGKPQYRLTGDMLTHFPIEDSFLIDRPIMMNIGDQDQRQTMVSDRAVVAEDNTKVHMYGNVVVDRPAAEKVEAFHMTTDYLLIFPEDDTMQTPDPVVIQRGTTTLTGKGLFANNVTREMRILNQTKVLYTSPPPAR